MRAMSTNIYATNGLGVQFNKSNLDFDKIKLLLKNETELEIVESIVDECEALYTLFDLLYEEMGLFIFTYDGDYEYFLIEDLTMEDINHQYGKNFIEFASKTKDEKAKIIYNIFNKFFKDEVLRDKVNQMSYITVIKQKRGMI